LRPYITEAKWVVRIIFTMDHIIAKTYIHKTHNMFQHGLHYNLMPYDPSAIVESDHASQSSVYCQR
jgi:hypothetical protein